MTREEVEKLVTRFYANRLTNDPDKSVSLFCNTAHFQLTGASDSSEIATQVSGAEPLRELIGQLVKVWEWKRHEIVSLIIDGSNVAVRYDLETVHVPSGKLIKTQVMDQLVIDDQGKVVECIEFVDTAMVERLAN